MFVSGNTILQDLKYGFRTLGRTPWASTIIVFSLALGIGVNTAVFTAYRAFVARQIDARNPAEIVNIALLRDSGVAEYSFSNPDYETYRDSVRAFGGGGAGGGGLIAFRPMRVTLSNAGGTINQRAAFQGSALGRLGLFAPAANNAEFAQVYAVSDNYFEVLGVAALHGRTLSTARQTTPATASAEPPGVLISANYWQRRFGGDPSFLGKTVHLNGVAVTVIGVTPRDFVGTGVATPAFWLPLSLEPQLNADPNWLHDRENRKYRLFGRLAPGVTLAQATAEVSVVADHLRTLHAAATTANAAESAKPATVLVWPGSPFPLPLSHYPGLTLSILLIMAGAAMVLAVAAANAGSLQLAQARSRETELRTRLSLGATRSRIIRQLLTENALIGIFAGILAIFFSWAFLKFAVRAYVESVPVEFFEFVWDVNPSFTIFSYVSLISLIAGILAGLTPALHSPNSALSSSERSSTASFRGRRLQDLLVALQVAFTLVLIITGAMFVRGATNLLGIESGYDIRRLAQIDFQFPNDSGGYTEGRKAAFVDELRQKLLALPGVARVTSARPPGSSLRTAVALLDSEPGRNLFHYTYVQGDYFETLGIPLQAGRTFDVRNENPHSVILSESAARQIFPASRGVNPVGRSLRLGAIDEKYRPAAELAADGAVYEVIGIARDTRGSAEFDGSDSKQSICRSRPQHASPPPAR